MTFFPLFDCLDVTVRADGIVRLTCDPNPGCAMTDNLVYRAAVALKTQYGVPEQGADIHLKKQIPAAAGLGGGSSDAGVVLRALDQLWGLGCSPEALSALGVQLGADVPFFIGGEAALAEGVGEKLTPVSGLAARDLVLVNPGIPLSTPRVFKKWKEYLTTPSHPYSIPDCRSGKTWFPRLENDLEPVARGLSPVIDQIIKVLDSVGAKEVLTSGSGPSVFGLFPDAKAREEAAHRIKRMQSEWRVFQGQTFNAYDLNALKNSLPFGAEIV